MCPLDMEEEGESGSVEGEEEEPIEEGQDEKPQARVRPEPDQPTPQEIKEHMVCHILTSRSTSRKWGHPQ